MLYKFILCGALLLASAAHAEPETKAAISRDAGHLAAALGITLEEAENRMRLADRAGVFQLRVRSDPDFAGIYIVDVPKLQIVALFKGDAKAKLGQYVTDEAFVARSVAFSLAELTDVQSELPALFRKAGIKWLGSDLDIEANRVVVHVTDETQAHAATKAGTLDLPKAVTLDVVDGQIIDTAQRAPGIENFPQARHPTGSHMQALISGNLIVENGCLRIGGPDIGSSLVLWPSSARLVTDGDTIAVQDGKDGGTLVVGTTVAISGGKAPVAPPEDWLVEPVSAGCKGPYWIAVPGW